MDEMKAVFLIISLLPALDHVYDRARLLFVVQFQREKPVPILGDSRRNYGYAPHKGKIPGQIVNRPL